MKRFFLYAVAIAAICSSCETDDEVFLTSSTKENFENHFARNVETTDYQIYQNIVNSYDYNKNKTYEENIALFEEHVNFEVLNYYQYDNHTYTRIDFMQLGILQIANINFIGQLNYSNVMKQAIYDINENNYNHLNYQTIVNDFENNLIQTLSELYGNDNKLNKKRTIAYAYGAQYNIIQAILYAGAIELMQENISN